jgi:predicted double-glycine peptidase
MLGGKISISRLNSTNKALHNSININVLLKDNQIINIRMTPEQFAHALTGTGGCNCEYEIIERIGAD